MSQEKPNNHSFRSKLADMSSLQGVDLHDKTVAWERLHERLHKKSNHVKPLWYWAAAAFVIAVSIPFVIKKDSADSIIKETAGTVIKKQLDTNNKNQLPLAKTIPVKDTKAFIVRKAGNDNPAAELLPQKDDAPVADKNNIKLFPDEIQQQPITENIQAVATAPVKKKLRVININELETPVEQATAASNLPVTVFGKRFKNMPTEPAPVQEYAGLLKIKISLKQ